MTKVFTALFAATLILAPVPDTYTPADETNPGQILICPEEEEQRSERDRARERVGEECGACDDDVRSLAQMAYGEARGLAAYEIAACMWVALNRLDHGGYGDTVVDVVSAPGQFAGYSAENPVEDELAAIARDVLTRHDAEQNGESVPREIGREYLWFSGREGHNWFRAAYDGPAVLPEEG